MDTHESRPSENYHPSTLSGRPARTTRKSKASSKRRSRKLMTVAGVVAVVFSAYMLVLSSILSTMSGAQ